MSRSRPAARGHDARDADGFRRDAKKHLGQNFLHDRGVIDRIVPEPVGGAHRDPQAAAEALGVAIGEELDGLAGKSVKQLRRAREDRFLGIDEPRKERRKKP